MENTITGIEQGLPPAGRTPGCALTRRNQTKQPTTTKSTIAPRLCATSVFYPLLLIAPRESEQQATVGGGGVGRGGGATHEYDDKEGEVREQQGEEVFFVDGTGRVNAGGGLETGPSGNLVAKGGLVSEGSTVLERKRAVRGGTGPGASGGDGEKGGSVWNSEDGEGGGVEVDANLGTFFEVPDDGREGSANFLRIKVGSCCWLCIGLGVLAAESCCCWLRWCCCCCFRVIGKR